MSGAPLLSDQDADADLELAVQRDSKEAPRWGFGSVREFLEHWWGVTNDEGYLRSLFGRRRIGSVVMPTFLGLCATSDLLSIAVQPSDVSAIYLAFISTEVTFLFVAILARRLDLRGHLWDVLMSLCFTAWSAAASLSTPRALLTFTMALVFLYLFVQFFIGVRPAFIAASAAISVYVDVVIDERNGGIYSQHVVLLAVCLVFMVPMLFGLDYLLALGFKRSEEQLIQARLLERGCDGYFALNTETGTVLSASQGVIALLGDEFCGGKLVEFVRNKDKAKIVELCGRNSLSAPMVATLFSARSAGAMVKEFDAKLTPIEHASLDIYLILQLAGEVREVHKAERPPPPAGRRKARRQRAVAAQDRAASGSGPRDRPQDAVPEAAPGGGGDVRSPRSHDGSSEDAGREEGKEQSEAGASESPSGPQAAQAATDATLAKCEEVLVRNLWLKFNAGGKRFELQDGCEELLPLDAGKGLLDYIPSAFRSRVETWALDEVQAFEASGERPIPVSLLGFELSLPIWVLNAKMAWLEVLPSQTDESNVEIFPVILHLQGVRAKRRPTSLLDGEGHSSDEDIHESASRVGNKFISW